MGAEKRLSVKDIYTTAFELHSLGYPVIPSGGGDKGKAPLLDWKKYQDCKPSDADLAGWQQKLKPRLWGIVTGELSGLVVVDADTPDAVRMMEAELGPCHVVTPRGGAHWYFRHPGGKVKTLAGVQPGLDIRGDGGFINIVGMSSFGAYRIRSLPTPDSLIVWAKLPKGVKDALSGSSPVRDGTPRSALLEGHRNSELTSLAGILRRKGVQREAITAELLETNETRCVPPLTSEEVVKIAESISRYDPAPEISWEGHFKLTDLGNAERLGFRHGKDLRFCYQRALWLRWSGMCWEWDEGDKIAALAKETVRDIYHEAGVETDASRRGMLASHAQRSESDQRLAALIKLAQSEPGIPVRLSELDADPWLFNCLSGCIDLRSGQLRPHRREDLITTLVDLPFDPEAKCPIWMKFLSRVTEGNEELTSYLQRAVGYSLTGVTKLQVVFFLYGTGSNGKTTFMNTVRRIVGTYGDSVNAELFMAKDRGSGGPREGLANLAGKRLVVASELEENKQLNVALVKNLTGGEPVKADRKYEHEFEFSPQFKPWLVGNHKPVIPDTTFSTWRRLKLIPFAVIIPPHEMDPDLPSKLEAELPGILAWAVEGCLNWQRFGLQEPAAVQAATSVYRASEDRLAEFFEDCCVLEPAASAPKPALLEAYQQWSRQNGLEALKTRAFRAGLLEKGITEGKTGSTRYWRGLALKKMPDRDFLGDRS